MRFKDKKGIDVIQFGTGDVGIGVLGELATEDFFGISFFPIPETKIGEYLPEYDNKLDYEVGAYCKLVFSQASSVTVLIEQLQIVETALISKEGLV